MFGLHFVKTELIPKEIGKCYSDIYDMRHSGDYDDFVEFTKEDVLDVLGPAEDLIIRVEKMLQ